jgi:hypothetical protein
VLVLAAEVVEVLVTMELVLADQVALVAQVKFWFT